MVSSASASRSNSHSSVSGETAENESDETEGMVAETTAEALSPGFSYQATPRTPASPEQSSTRGLVFNSARVVPVEQFMLGLRYLRLVDAHSLRGVEDLTPLLCRACERPLSYTDQLLCTRRRWGFGRTVPQPACFVNSVVRENTKVQGRYDEHLAQGLMGMADVWCICGCQVGYRFCADKTPAKRNLNQVGRFGLVVSTFSVGQYKIAHPKVATAAQG
mmetsp:Transcript_50487/g.131355  ORF Transcript_50487/g.131355 Transcript_50487/m.131355 type:complete len:219 (+) Transcript_50487:979-1635(+)